MKAIRSRAPSVPREVQYQSWRITSPAAPQLNVDISPFSMSMQNGSYAASPPRSLSPPNSQLLLEQTTPSRPPPRRPSRLRQSSGMTNLSRDQSPGPIHTDSPQTSDLGDSVLQTPTTASHSGTSGVVIERLTTTNDRLKRDLNAEIQHRIQLEQENEVLIKKINSLSFENDNLQQAKDTDAHLLKRSNNRVEEFKRRLETEKEQRQYHAGEMDRMKIERDHAVEDCRNQTSQADSRMKQAVNCADVWEKSHRQLRDEYQRRLNSLVETMDAGERDRRDYRERLHRLSVMMEQMHQQNSAMAKNMAEMAVFNEANDKKIRQLEKQAELDAADMERTKKLDAENIEQAEKMVTKKMEHAKKVMGEAQYLINLARNAAERNGAL